MPVPTVKCSICGEDVTKRQTYLVDSKTGNRACKKHEGVVEKKDELLEQKKREFEAKQREIEDRMKRLRAHQFGTPEFEQRSNEARNCCWKCLRQGLHHREFFLRRLIAIKKVEMKEERPVLAIPIGPQGIEDCKKVIGAMKSPFKDGDKFLYIGVWPVPDNKLESTLKGIRTRFSMGVQMFRIVQLCAECGKALGYSVEDFFPKIEPEDFFKTIMVGETIRQALDPAIQAQAGKELDIEHEQEVHKN